MQQLYNNLFQVPNKIIGLGFTYYPRQIDLDKTTWPKEITVFGKPLSSLILNPKLIQYRQIKQYPIFHQGIQLQFINCKYTKNKKQVELGVVIGKQGFNIKYENAMNYVGGYCLALDFTNRKLSQLRQEQKDFFLCKGGDYYTPCSEFIPKENVTDPNNIELELLIDGQVKQYGNTKELAFDIATQISYISDLILTGTPPEGLSNLSDGQRVQAYLRQSNTILSQLDIEIKIDTID